MKNIIVILVICLIGTEAARISKKDESKMLAVHADCAKEARINLVVATQIVKTTKAKRIPATDCFIACMLVQMDIMTENYVLNDKMLLQRLMEQNVDKRKAEGVVNKCRNVKGTSKCNLAGNLYDCFDFFRL